MRLKVCVLAALVVVIAAVPATYALAATARSAFTYPPGYTVTQGKALYRQYCGQCHALNQALAAGFGSNNGLGVFGGPSFNNLRVPYDLSIEAVTGSFAGHEVVVTRITWQQLDTIAAFVAAATATNPYLARVSDG